MRYLSIVFIFYFVSAASWAQEKREYVKLPEHMQSHMLGNMRDHLAALAEASQLMANQKWDKASDVIERRIGMSSLEAHGADHMAKFMPKPMREMGTEMHRSASRLARSMQEEDPQLIFKNFSNVMTRCNACHVQYRVK